MQSKQYRFDPNIDWLNVQHNTCNICRVTRDMRVSGSSDSCMHQSAAFSDSLIYGRKMQLVRLSSGVETKQPTGTSHDVCNFISNTNFVDYMVGHYLAVKNFYWKTAIGKTQGGNLWSKD